MELAVKEKICVFIGGGKVAWRKLQPLLQEGARVLVIAPRAEAEIKKLAEQGRLQWQQCAYRPGMLPQDTLLVFCAADDLAVNQLAAAEAHSLGALVNMAMKPEQGDFLLPAVMRRGRLKIAVSTEGAMPEAARFWRQELETRFTEQQGEFLEWLAEQRQKISRLGTSRQRTLFWRQVFAGPAGEALKAGKFEEAEAMITDAISSFGTQS